MVEIEIGVMVRQCLNRRIGDKPTLISEITQWERRRNREKARIDWMFTVERARQTRACVSGVYGSANGPCDQSRSVNRSDPVWSSTSEVTGLSHRSFKPLESSNAEISASVGRAVPSMTTSPLDDKTTTGPFPASIASTLPVSK